MNDTESKKHHLSPEELKELIAEGGMELPDEDLEQISGGWNNDQTCPPGQHNYQFKGLRESEGKKQQLYVCSKCNDSYLI